MTPNLDALAKLAPFTSRSTWGGDEFIGNDGETIETDVAEAALNEWPDLRATIELVAGNLLAAQEKREDATCSANAHIDEAVEAIKHHAKDGTYSDAAKALRVKLWSGYSEIAKENAELRAYRERTEAALASHCDGVRDLLNQLRYDKPLMAEMDALKDAGLWREPGQGATDGK